MRERTEIFTFTFFHNTFSKKTTTSLQHYTDLPDIRRVIVNTHALDPQALVEFFGTLSAEWALECLRELLKADPKANLPLAVQIAKEYTEQIGASKIVDLFEAAESPAGLYLYLGSYVAFSQDPDVHFKYIEAAAKTGNVKEVERATRESDFYPPERTKRFLMDAKLPDARPLINVCDRHGMVGDLTGEEGKERRWREGERREEFEFFEF